MLEEKTRVLCQAYDCRELAVKHLRLGSRFFDMKMYPGDGATPETYVHFDLCPVHIAKAYREYSSIREDSLNGCRDECNGLKKGPPPPLRAVQLR